jgi:hypothetical protein
LSNLPPLKVSVVKRNDDCVIDQVLRVERHLFHHLAQVVGDRVKHDPAVRVGLVLFEEEQSWQFQIVFVRKGKKCLFSEDLVTNPGGFFRSNPWTSNYTLSALFMLLVSDTMVVLDSRVKL